MYHLPTHELEQNTCLLFGLLFPQSKDKVIGIYHWGGLAIYLENNAEIDKLDHFSYNFPFNPPTTHFFDPIPIHFLSLSKFKSRTHYSSHLSILHLLITPPNNPRCQQPPLQHHRPTQSQHPSP